MINKTSWGEHEIAGPKNFYRQNLLLSQLRRYCKPNGCVLDIGCGSGALLFRMAKEKFIVTGIDSSVDYLQFIKEGAQENNLGTKIQVALGDAGKLCFPNQEYDGVVLSEVLEHLREDKKAINEACRVLKPSGYVFITVPGNPSLWSKVDEGAGHYRRYTENSLSELIEGSGLTVCHMRWWGFPVTRLYERVLFNPWMRNRFKTGANPGAGGMLGSLAKIKSLTLPISWVFSIDNIFSKFPYGIGLISVAKKGNFD